MLALAHFISLIPQVRLSHQFLTLEELLRMCFFNHIFLCEESLNSLSGKGIFLLSILLRLSLLIQEVTALTRHFLLEALIHIEPEAAVEHCGMGIK